LNLTFLSKELSQHFKRRYKDILKTALHEDLNQTKFVESVNTFFEEPFNDYLLNQPDISNFIEDNEDYSFLSEYIDADDLENSLNCLVQRLNPNIAFDNNSVNLMSIHKSKGLQADIVFINSLVNGVLPNAIKGIDTIEAQRRLLFVGMSRTKKDLYILSPVEWEGRIVHKLDKSQFKYNYRKKLYSGRASQFVDEMK
jgi:superfamily I DNA/RNA helicase